VIDMEELEYGVCLAKKLHIPLICLMYTDSRNRIDMKYMHYIDENFENFIVK